MLSTGSQFHVYVTAAGDEASRRAALVQILAQQALDPPRERAFLRGERVLVLTVAVEADAQRAAAGLRAPGLHAEVQPGASAMDMVDLESFTRDEPVAATSAAPSAGMFDVGAGLVGLDFGEESSDAPPPAAARDAIALSPPALDDAPPAAAPPPRVPAARIAPPPVPVPHASPSPHGDALELDASSRFAPPSIPKPADELRMERAAPRPAPAPPPPPPEELVEPPRCDRHGVELVRGACARCVAEEEMLRGRLFGGKLHHNLALRIGLGLVGGLLLGWIVTAPMARRAERSVAYVRDKAARERARPLEEAQARATELDAQANDEAQSAFYRTLGIWGLITAAVTGAWFRLT